MDHIPAPLTHPPPRAVQGHNPAQAIPLASPASASSSTLITTPLPIGRSKESLRLSSSVFHEDPVPDPVASPDDRPQRTAQTRHVVLAGTRTRNGTALPPTRMSASGFVEPHHSNVPRRVRVRGQTNLKTGKKMEDRGADNREDDSESDGGNGGGRRVRELRRSVKEALTPGRRWSDSEDEDKDKDTKEHSEDGDKKEGFALQHEEASRTAVQNDDEDTTMLSASVTASQSLYATHGGPTPTSSRNLNTERTPLHLLSLKLPPSPTDGVGPVLESAPAAMAVVQGALRQIPPCLLYPDQHDGLPRTVAAAGSGAFPLTRVSGMGPAPWNAPASAEAWATCRGHAYARVQVQAYAHTQDGGRCGRPQREKNRYLDLDQQLLRLQAMIRVPLGLRAGLLPFILTSRSRLVGEENDVELKA